jgi:hypothetical protein
MDVTTAFVMVDADAVLVVGMAGGGRGRRASRRRRHGVGPSLTRGCCPCINFDDDIHG